MCVRFFRIYHSSGSSVQYAYHEALGDSRSVRHGLGPIHSEWGGRLTDRPEVNGFKLYWDPPDNFDPNMRVNPEKLSITRNSPVWDISHCDNSVENASGWW